MEILQMNEEVTKNQKILGLDIGTNSVGWSLVELDSSNNLGKIIGMGSRIIPMSQDILGKFDSGQSVSQTAERTGFRGTRRLIERTLLRRERLHRVLNIMGFLPEYYAADIDFDHHFGQFKKDKEPKLAYKINSSGEKEFIFKGSHNEMQEEFRKSHPDLFYIKPNGEEVKIKYDWTVYYLRKKALTEKISKEELAWIILNFNQKRGYYQLRGEEEEVEDNKEKTFEVLKVDKLVDSGEKVKDKTLYDVYFDNGWKYEKQVVKTEDWEGKTKEFIVTTSQLASGDIKRTYKAVNSEQDWIAIKQKTEKVITGSGESVGKFIYNSLLDKPNQKIRGKLVRTIERHFYKDELRKILEKQKEFHPELQDNKLYIKCINELYRHNEAHKSNIENRDFTYLFLDDIIFYQRPLKSQKHLISDCALEYRNRKDENGNIVKEGIKCIAKSNPLYQEFRLLQWFKNLKVFRIDGDKEYDITDELIETVEDKEQLYEWLNDKAEIDQVGFLKYPGFDLEGRLKVELGLEQYKIYKKDKEKGLDTYFRWNYGTAKTVSLNQTRNEILKRLKRAECDSKFLTEQAEKHLWHILYSVEDKFEIEKALKKYAVKYDLPDKFVEIFKKHPPLKKDYGAFSEKAIKKLLTLMRFGKWWNEENFNPKVKERIGKFISGEYDENIKIKAREKAISLKDIKDFQNLPLWLASYVVYNRHSEVSDIKYWRKSEDIELLKQHFLRNPIVEQIINETLQTVREIWNYYGKGEEDFFDEIHVELGREMKNTADDRKEIANNQYENERTNIRIKLLLAELLNDGVSNVRPHSPMQQEILKIYEDGVYNNSVDEYKGVKIDEIDEIRKKFQTNKQPSIAELNKYKLWLEQGYRSPYTGEIIPLSKLFTPAYEIEHIIPQSRFFDNSMSNKVICEAEVNKEKGNQLAAPFIKNNTNMKIELSKGKFVTLLSFEDYEKNVKKYFGCKKNKAKMKKLLMDEIPESFIERQLNDTRYISKIVKNLLSNIVRQDGEEEGTAKNILVMSGGVTSILKQDWGLNDVWNEIITPRFERLNQIAGYEKYGSKENKDGKQVFQINTLEPELLKLNKKRIDHRHHAMDALVIACATRSHINFINNQNALSKEKTDKKEISRDDLRKKLCTKKYDDKEPDNYNWTFNKPWDTFTQDAKNKLYEIIISFKKSNRVINKTVNYYQKWEKQTDGKYKKVLKKQIKGDNWAIRKPLHKATYAGIVNLRKKKIVSFSSVLDNVDNIVNKSLRYKVKELRNSGLDNKAIAKFFKDLKYEWEDENVSKVEVYYFTNDDEKTKVVSNRTAINESFDKKTIETVIDNVSKKILLKHLENNNNDPKTAFSPEGLERMNNNIVQLNSGKFHHPIYKVNTYDVLGQKFNVGYNGNKSKKYVIAATGTNLFFGIYADEKGNRSYETIPLNVVIERQKQGLTSCPEENEKLDKLLFSLSPNDLVYVPTAEEQENPQNVDFNNLNKEQVKRVYKVEKFSQKDIYFIRNEIASLIIQYDSKTKFGELESQNKLTTTMCQERLKIAEICWKLELDRLGNIKKVTK